MVEARLGLGFRVRGSRVKERAPWPAGLEEHLAAAAAADRGWPGEAGDANLREGPTAWASGVLS
jgi:hypothetical protein